MILATTGQRISPKTGRIEVSKKAWFCRFLTIACIAALAGYNINTGWQLHDWLIMYATILPFHALLIFIFGWFGYRTRLHGKYASPGNELVSVIIPIFNQRTMIKQVISAILDSTYWNLEVIAVDDGSTDGTAEILDGLQKEFADSRLKIVHKPNGGKRVAVANGFYNSHGKFLVLIDSDSIVSRDSITEFMKAFASNKDVGAVVGNARVWNSRKNFLTKLQDTWYDYAFNIHKTAESYFGNVLCCSGCLAGYRREAIAGFIPYWAGSKLHNSDDRDLTTFVTASKWTKGWLMSGKRLESDMSGFDDSEDRALTAHTLSAKWKTVYIPTAVVQTDVPETWRGFIKQQKRWKKGYIRSNFYVSTFFWKKHPLMASIFYIEFMVTFTAPIIALIVGVYEPFILHNWTVPLVYTAGTMAVGLAQGLDYKFRDPQNSQNWKYKPLMNFIASFVISWVIVPALWNYKRNEWLTR